MIIKGGSRGGPRQLAAHLFRTDTNERVSVLELASPAGSLREALRDWQFLASGTRGTKGLYHANIDPDARYTMTPEQWKRAVDVLEKELGFDGQPRAVVMHEKHGRQHIHVVWQRTDVDTMKLRTDSLNYPAHERASMKLEQEFGHEHVPGKHAKRDRTKQPEFPKSKFVHGEWQQAERTKIDPRDRKDAVMAIYQSCDNGQALKAGLEEEGYVLAIGDSRALVIVDEIGEIHSLARQIKGVNAKELTAFTADIDRKSLPTPDQAKSMQLETTKQRTSARVEVPKKAANDEARPLDPAEPEKQSDALLAESERIREAAAKRRDEEFKAIQTTAVYRDIQKQAIEEAVAVRAAAERRKLAEHHDREREQLNHVLEIEKAEKIKALDQRQRHQRDQLAAKFRSERDARDGILARLDRIIRPKRAKQFEDERKARAEALKARQRTERDGLIARLEREKKTELDERDERQAQRLRELDQRKTEDLARYLREAEAARRLLEERQRTQARQKRTMKDRLNRPPKPTR